MLISTWMDISLCKSLAFCLQKRIFLMSASMGRCSSIRTAEKNYCCRSGRTEKLSLFLYITISSLIIIIIIIILIKRNPFRHQRHRGLIESNSCPFVQQQSRQTRDSTGIINIAPGLGSRFSMAISGLPETRKIVKEKPMSVLTATKHTW